MMEDMSRWEKRWKRREACERKNAAFIRPFGDVCQGVLMAYYAAMVLIYPLYYTDGYRSIGNDKFFLFRNMTLSVLAVLCTVRSIGFAAELHQGQLSALKLLAGMSVTDWFVYGYFIMVLLSYLVTPYQEFAVWGAEGWYMGMITQLMLVMIYYFFSRYFFWDSRFLIPWCIGAAAVFVLGILNRYSIYPLEMGARQPTFISTLGNINWYSGYFSVACPVGVMMFRSSRTLAGKLLLGSFCSIVFLTGATQGSSSGILALLALFYLLMLLSFRSNQDAKTFLLLCMVFGLSCQVGRLMRYLPGFWCSYESFAGSALTDSGGTLAAAAAAAVLLVLLTAAEKKAGFRVENFCSIRRIAAILPVFLLVIFLLLACGNTFLPGGLPFLREKAWFVLDGEWGNGRGAAWYAGAQAFASMDLRHKLSGIGSDCFVQYCYEIPEIAERLWETFANERLTNAHNEWLTMLVSVGIPGMICYAGIFISAFARLIRSTQRCACVCAAAVFVYTIHNMVSFQQVLSTPFVFILLGMGENLLHREKLQREEETKIEYKGN